MSQVFHDIEKKIIKALKQNPELTPEKLESITQLSVDQVRRGIEWLKLKNLAIVKESQKKFVSLGQNGIESLSKGLPERQLLEMIKDQPKEINEIQLKLKFLFGPAMGLAKKNHWIKTSENKIFISNPPKEIPEETILKQIGKNKIPTDEILNIKALNSLKNRPDYIIEDVIKLKSISLTEKAKKINLEESNSGAIDVEAEVPAVFVARMHPLKQVIDEIRETFVTLGFTEIIGNLSQSSFWNFDALFTPQDHPARELQDTFYIKGLEAKQFATSDQIRKVSTSHKKNWHYYWSIEEAKKMVLRTHTTCITIKHLAEKKPHEARIFSLGRVFRNEKVSYKHLVEFNQVEGVVVGKNATLRDLMGIQREFYKRIGLTKIKFWPTFFPYTEPSLQTMVYNERLSKWVELFGMGIFRPEVTKPLGINKPVLAWGGGIERIAMLKYGLDDVREFYNNNLNWLRSAIKCQ